MAMPPLPPLNISAPVGPSQAGDYGSTGEVGGMTVGDYYARGSRVRQGSGWQELGTLGVVGLAALGLWLWLG